MAKQIPLAKNIDSIVNLDRAFDKPEKMADHLNEPLEVQHASFTKGKDGEYCVLDVMNYNTNESFKLNCGGIVLLNIFRDILAANRFPVSCVFYTEAGNRMYFVRGIQESDLKQS